MTATSPLPEHPGVPDIRQSIVFVLDDDENQRDFIETLLEAAHFNVRIFTNGHAFLNAYDPHQPGCLVSDVMMPDINGLEVQDILLERHISIPIIFMTAHADVSMTRSALKKGAFDILEKPISTVELLDSVTQALDLDRKYRLRQREIETIKARLECLTKREREVLNLLVAGQHNKEIATELDLSLRTVETHRGNILKKMHVNNFIELLRIMLSIA